MTKHRTSHRAYRKKRARALSGTDLICAGCGEPINKDFRFPHPLSATADHVLPVAAGGHNLGELQPMHKVCNERKGKRTTPDQESRHVRKW